MVLDLLRQVVIRIRLLMMLELMQVSVLIQQVLQTEGLRTVEARMPRHTVFTDRYGAPTNADTIGTDA